MLLVSDDQVQADQSKVTIPRLTAHVCLLIGYGIGVPAHSPTVHDAPVYSSSSFMNASNQSRRLSDAGSKQIASFIHVTDCAITDVETSARVEIHQSMLLLLLSLWICSNKR